VFRASSEMALAGNYAAECIPVKDGAGPGFGSGRDVSVLPGETYVLSAFFFTSNLRGHLYVDLGDGQFEPVKDNLDAVRGTAGVDRWQFVYARFTAPQGVTHVKVRLSYDATFRVGEVGYIDDVAVTPAASFRAPTLEPFLSIEVSEVRVCWKSETSKSYQVQYRSEATADSWVNLGEPIPGSGSTLCASDAAVSPRRFYRIIAPLAREGQANWGACPPAVGGWPRRAVDAVLACFPPYPVVAGN